MTDPVLYLATQAFQFYINTLKINLIGIKIHFTDLIFCGFNLYISHLGTKVSYIIKICVF
jgi:hypothetical protein